MQLRINAGLSQNALGKELGVSKQSISNWENDNILPSIEMLERIADYFRVSTDYVLGRENLNSLDISGLNEVQTAHIQAIIRDILQK